ncbi:hypothetical protein ACFLZ2_05800 [Candidatus Margulisiibacteriota bacterium]
MKTPITLVLVGILLITLASGVLGIPEVYTSLIVDARGLEVEPGIAPKIFDEDGEEIYGTINIDPDYAIRKGIVQYYDSIGEAIRSGFIGNNPVIVRAINRGSHPYKADVVITNADALRILKANKYSQFLQDLKVAFIL